MSIIEIKCTYTTHVSPRASKLEVIQDGVAIPEGSVSPEILEELFADMLRQVAPKDLFDLASACIARLALESANHLELAREFLAEHDREVDW